jgi:hypothetical protein
MIPPPLPTNEQLESYLAKLEANPGSVVLLAITYDPECQNYAELRVGWFNADARKRLHRALWGEKRREAGKP